MAQTKSSSDTPAPTQSTQSAAPTVAKAPAFTLQLRPNTRKQLGDAIAYHQKMADDAKTRSGGDKLAAMHADVCKQLSDVLNASPVITGVDIALAKRPIRRTMH